VYSVCRSCRALCSVLGVGVTVPYRTVPSDHSPQYSPPTAHHSPCSPPTVRLPVLASHCSPPIAHHPLFTIRTAHHSRCSPLALLTNSIIVPVRGRVPWHLGAEPASFVIAAPATEIPRRCEGEGKDVQWSRQPRMTTRLPGAIKRTPSIGRCVGCSHIL
jgi:hypothetical protein